MNGRKRGALSPSLFPFLAVLVCTLGTLILLLALVAQDATDSAERQATAERAKATELASQVIESHQPKYAAAEVEAKIEEERFRVQQLIAFRDKQTADLEDRRDRMTHLEDHITRLREKLKQLGDEVDDALGETSDEAISETQLVTLSRQIEQQRTVIEKLHSESQSKAPRVVIVPHKGPNGTDRRPIYLECTHEGVAIWPEGSRITIQQLEGSDAVANPLDASLRVVRHHAMQTYGDTTPPYPLLVVRPDGIDTYAAARHAMEDWDDQFGYELVPADVELAFAAADPNLKQRLDTVIAEAVAHQTRPAIAGGGGGRGFPRSRPRVLSAASLDRDGRASGYHAARGEEDFGSSTYGSPYSASADSSSRGSYNDDSQRTRHTSNGIYGNGPYGSGSVKSGGPDSIDPAMEKRWTDQMRSAASEFNDNSLPGSTNLTESAMNGLQAALARSEGAGGTTNDQTDTDAERGPATDSSTPIDGDSDPDGKPSAEMPTSDMNLDGPAGSSDKALDSQGGNGGSQQTAAANSTSQAAPNRSAETNSSSGGAPQINMEMTPNRPPVRREGRNWALPAEVAGAHGNAIIRSIRVQCYADRFVLLAPASGGATEMFGFSGGDIDRATLQLATAIRDRVGRWGVALPGGRWQPKLDVEVMPGGETRFLQLKSLMNGSGVEVSGRTSP